MSIIGEGIILGTGGETASIVVTAPTGSTVTCKTPGGIVLTATEVGGTWTFSKLKSYGTYTITATNGAKTATETVLVDSAIQYDIEMSYLLWLYKAGNEYESVTGGFVFANDSSNVTGTKNSDNFQVSAVYDGKRGLFRTSNKIELSGYTKMSVEVEVTGVYKTYTSRFFGVATGTSVGDDVLDGATDFYNYRTGEQTTGSTIPKTVLSITLNQTIAQYVYAGISQGAGRIYNIWLE